MRLLLVRHGETPLNAARVMQPPDTPLSPRGLLQARAVAERLRAEALSALWSSDLPRAWQTADAIASACGGLAVLPQPLLHERNFGDLRGRPYDSLGFDPLAMQEAPPGGESVPQFEARIDRVFDAALIAAQATGGTFVLVTHGLVIHSLLSRRVALPPGTTLPTRIANASVTEIAAPAGPGMAPRALRIDCTAHLCSDRADDPLALSGG
jgi:broad specificity phosphatase PhoE